MKHISCRASLFGGALIGALMVGSSNAEPRQGPALATVSVVVSAPSEVKYIITNNHSAPIEAWQVLLTLSDAAGKSGRIRMTSDTYRFRFLGVEPDVNDGPIAAGTQRAIVFPISEGKRFEKIELTALVAYDYRTSGAPEQIRSILESRETDGRDAEAVLSVLLALPKDTSRRKTLIASLLSERAATSAPYAARREVDDLLRASIGRADADVERELLFVIKRLTAQRDAALGHKPRLTS